MFGRYSLDQEGLIYAGGEWNPEQYKIFPVDKDNIIPICDDEYFEDDIVGLFIQFVKTVYGEETLEENLKFIADARWKRKSQRSNPKLLHQRFLQRSLQDLPETSNLLAL